jgi:lipopolysaccharide/colanic/teichoic acid biosynthesis glycosyltransferase
VCAASIIIMLKRIFDILMTIITMPLWIPLIMLLAVVVGVKSGRPIFFSQARAGVKGKVFRIFKFRTMSDERDENGCLLSDAQRLTNLGLFLRRTSLDELPNLFNVLLGQLSLVGPRPLIADYLSLYTPEQARRHEVRPGITGWAQVNGRNAISWADKFALDVWYVDHRSLWLDVRILWLTVRKVLLREGINAAGEAEMPRFEGDKS